MLFSSNILATRLEIKKNSLLLSRRAKISAKSNKIIDAAEFVINALASSGIPIISQIVSLFKVLFEAHKNMKKNSLHIKVKGLEEKTYPCSYQGIGMVYGDVKAKAKAKAVERLKEAKIELEVACLNFGIEYTTDDKKLCYDIQAKLKELEKTGKKLVIPKVIENLKKFIDDERSYKVKLKKRPGAILNGEYHLTKLVFKKEGIIDMRDQDDQEEFFAKKSNEIYNKLLNQHNEGLNLIYITKKDSMFGVLRNFNCKNIDNSVSDAEKIGVATKLAGVWTAGGFMKQCVAEIEAPGAKWLFILELVVDIIDIVVSIIINIYAYGAWKYVRTAFPALKTFYYLCRATHVKITRPDDSMYFSRYLGSAVGSLVNIVMTAIKNRRRMLK